MSARSVAIVIAILAGCSSSTPHSLRSWSDAIERESIVEVMTAAADWQLAHPSKHPSWDWTQAPFYIGLNAFAPLSKDPQRYLAAVRRNGEENRWRPGPRPLCADDHAITQSYFLLHRVQKDRAMIEPALQNFDAVILFPFDESLEFVSWEKTWRQWTWCDALFMSPPALTMAAQATGDRRYLDFMNRMWWKTTDYLYDKEEHLYFRDSRFFDQRGPNGRKIFWSRGNGWVLAGLARVLQNLPVDYAERPRYERLFREMAAKIVTLQQSDGYWRSSLLDPETLPLPETSGTAFYTYALAWGINEGLLERAAYEPAVRRGWAALVRAVHPDGMLGYVQRIGDQPGDTSPSGTEIYGVGALLLAGSEVHRLAGLRSAIMASLQTWDVVVHGRTHRVEIDRSPESGKHLVRVDGRIALKPFSESRGEFRLEIDGKPFLLHVADGSYRLEDKGSRYHDTSAARAGTNLGQITICRGLEHIAVVTDEAVLRIEKMSEALAAAASGGAGGGLVGSIIAQAGVHLAQKITDNLGEKTVDSPIRDFTALDSEVSCRLEHLPLDLVSLFSEEIDLSCRVLVVPRRAVRSATVPGKKILIETDKTRGAEAKPHKFDTLHESQKAIDHLCSAGYPLTMDTLERASDAARQERERRKKTAATAPPPVAAPPLTTPPPVAAPRAFSGLSEVRWTAPLVTTIGRDPSLLAEMEADAKAWAVSYPKTVSRRVRVEDPFRNLGKERYDVVHLHGTFDDKTRFKEVGGFTISLKDLITRLVDGRVRMLWLASANNDQTAAQTLQWAAGLNFFLVMTIVRGADYSAVLESALRRLSAGEPLSTVLPEIERASPSRWRMTGRGESIFLAQ